INGLDEILPHSLPNATTEPVNVTAPILVNIHLTEVFLGIFIGAVTFTGSVVAFGKLCGKISSKPLMLPNRHKMNLAALV
ncbi:NAD(P)(+) transhydrogenase (Re/Si-specific) subunit beta, partial [Escherichia sp. TWPC-MK]